MEIVTFKFQSKKLMDEFLGWLSDGGGEQEFMGATELDVDFDYSSNTEVIIKEWEDEDE